jgi:DNA/RNA-binding domain of Phe-tRNA-synthetase-like protein
MSSPCGTVQMPTGSPGRSRGRPVVVGRVPADQWIGDASAAGALSRRRAGGRAAARDHGGRRADVHRGLRRPFAAFGATRTQYRSAAEALLRRPATHGDIRSINTLVDLGNLVSIRYALPVAVVDLAGIVGGTTVRFATGTERYTDLGAAEVGVPEPREVVFVDRAGVACARRASPRRAAGCGRFVCRRAVRTG